MGGKGPQTAWLELSPKPDYEDGIDRDWLREAVNARLVCPLCMHRLPHARGQRVDVRLRDRPYSRPFGDVTYAVAWIARREFVQAITGLTDDLRMVFTEGSIILRNGRVSESFVSLSARDVVAIRGGPQSGSRTHCIQCRRFLYFPMPWESHHVLTGDLAEGRNFYASALGTLIVRTSMWEQVPAELKKKIKAWPLPVRDEPLDGIKDFPTLWP